MNTFINIQKSAENVCVILFLAWKKFVNNKFKSLFLHANQFAFVKVLKNLHKSN